MKCDVCGKKYTEQDFVCPHCGANLLEEDPENNSFIDSMPEIHNELNLIQEQRELRAKRKKLRFRISMVVLTVIFCLAAGFGAMHFFKNYGKLDKDAASETNLIKPTGVPGNVVKKFLGEGFTGVQIVDEASALSAVESALPEFGNAPENLSYRLENHITVNGDSYYRFQQTVGDVPVVGGEMIVFSDGAGRPLALNGRFVETSGLDLTPKIESAKAANSINAYINNLSRENRIVEGANVTLPSLAICNYDGNTYLAYTANASGYSEQGPFVAYDVFVDADTGAGIFISHTASFENEDGASAPDAAEDEAEPKAPIIKEGAVSFYMVNDKFGWNDPEKPSSVEQIDVSGDISEYVANANAVLNKAHNYFATKFDWRGLDGKETTTKVYLNTNAYVPDHLPLEFAQYANDVLMFVQNPENGMLLNENVAVHEYAHGVMRHIAHLSGTNAANENAILAESLADVFAELAEGDKPDWVHGVRNLMSPDAGYHKTLPAQINLTKTEECYFYSTILSHAAYEMYANGIGTEKLGQLHFRTLCLLNSDSGFSDYRSAMELSAYRMHKAGTLSDTQLSIVIDALDRASVTGPRLYQAEIPAMADEISEEEMLAEDEEDPNEIVIE